MRRSGAPRDCTHQLVQLLLLLRRKNLARNALSQPFEPRRHDAGYARGMRDTSNGATYVHHLRRASAASGSETAASAVVRFQLDHVARALRGGQHAQLGRAQRYARVLNGGPRIAEDEQPAPPCQAKPSQAKPSCREGAKVGRSRWPRKALTSSG